MATQEEIQLWGGQRASPFIQALRRQFGERVDPTRRKIFSTFADRGLGISGLAEEGVSRGLAELESERIGKEAEATAAGEAQIRQEDVARQQLEATKRARPKARTFRNLFGVI